MLVQTKRACDPSRDREPCESTDIITGPYHQSH